MGPGVIATEITSSLGLCYYRPQAVSLCDGWVVAGRVSFVFARVCVWGTAGSVA